MVNTISVQDTTLVSEALSVRVQCLCLVKRSRALLESIPTRDNQARAGECSRAGLGRVMATEALLFPIIHLPCHASQNSPSPRRKTLPSCESSSDIPAVPAMAASGLSSWPKASNHLLSASAFRRARYRMRSARSREAGRGSGPSSLRRVELLPGRTHGTLPHPDTVHLRILRTAFLSPLGVH